MSRFSCHAVMSSFKNEDSLVLFKSMDTFTVILNASSFCSLWILKNGFRFKAICPNSSMCVWTLSYVLGRYHWSAKGCPLVKCR